MNQTEINIPKYKLKQIGLLLASIVFVYIGFEMIHSDFKSSRMSSGWTVFFGYVGIAFFGLGGLFIFFNLWTSKPALIINSQGITNNSHLGGGYLIRWENIKSLKIISIQNQRMIKVDLKDNEEVLGQVNYITKKWMKANQRIFGTPTFIPSVMIKMDLEAVLNLLREQKKLKSKKN